MRCIRPGLSSRTGSGYHARVRLASEAKTRGRLTTSCPPRWCLSSMRTSNPNRPVPAAASDPLMPGPELLLAVIAILAVMRGRLLSRRSLGRARVFRRGRGRSTIRTSDAGSKAPSALAAVGVTDDRDQARRRSACPPGAYDRVSRIGVRRQLCIPHGRRRSSRRPAVARHAAAIVSCSRSPAMFVLVDPRPAACRTRCGPRKFVLEGSVAIDVRGAPRRPHRRPREPVLLHLPADRRRRRALVVGPRITLDPGGRWRRVAYIVAIVPPGAGRTAGDRRDRRDQPDGAVLLAYVGS